MIELCHKDTATFYNTEPDVYGNNKTVVEQENVDCTFLQSTGFSHTSFQDSVDSDSICYVDQHNQFVIDNHMRLEGMYLKMKLYGSTDSESWYKVIAVAVNRDHLLTNTIDNVELALKKTRPLETGVS